MAGIDCRTECIMEEKIDDIAKTTTQTYDRLVGTMDKKGMIGDVEDLKAWRVSQSTRTKSRSAWIYGILGALVIKAFDWIPKILHSF